MALKAGTEDRKKVAIAAALGIVVVGLFAWELNGVFGGSSPAPAVQAPVVRTVASAGQPTAAGPSATRIVVDLTHLDPTLHPEIMADAESLEYTGAGRNIFSVYSAPPRIEAVRGPVRPSAAQAMANNGPPPPPAIDLKFFGYEAHGGNRKAFLLHGDNVFIASEGDVVDHRYKVMKIAPFSIQITDLLFNNTQTLPLAQS